MPASAPAEPEADHESSETEAAERPAPAPPRADAAPHRVPVSGAEDVAILEAELRAAKSRLDLTAAMHLQGGATALELQESRSAVEITEQKLAKAMREYAAQERLLELDLQQARTNLDAAQAELDESREINQRSPGTIPPMQLKRQETAVRQAELEVQRAQTLLDLHRKPGEETTP